MKIWWSKPQKSVTLYDFGGFHIEASSEFVPAGWKITTSSETLYYMDNKYNTDSFALNQ